MPYYIKFDFDCENEPPKVEIANLAPELFSEFRSKCYTVGLTAADKCYTVRPSDSNQPRTKEHEDDNCNRNAEDSWNHRREAGMRVLRQD